MSARKRIGLAATAVVAFCCATCAPTGKPSKDAVAPEDPAATGPEPEQIAVMPAPAPTGPRYRIEAAVRHVRDRDLLTTNGFWTVFHGILGLGPGVTLRDPVTGQRVNAVEYIAGGGEMRGLEFLPTRHGIDVRTFAGGTGVGQGHQDQFIAEMAQWGMPADKPFLVLGRDYTFMDFVRQAQMRARVTADQELGWAVLVLSQYLGTDLAWTNAFGEKLRFEDLLHYELKASMDTAACGGTHRLFGLTWAYHLHLQRGGKTEGVWKEIAANTAQHRDLARKYQNADGSFSTNFFRGPGDAPDKQLRINTTGHTLEWLALALSDEEMKAEWVGNAAYALAMMILDMQDASIEGGSLYHAVHGLLMYYARVYDRKTLGPPELLIPLPPSGSESKVP